MIVTSLFTSFWYSVSEPDGYVGFSGKLTTIRFGIVVHAHRAPLA